MLEMAATLFLIDSPYWGTQKIPGNWQSNISGPSSWQVGQCDRSLVNSDKQVSNCSSSHSHILTFLLTFFSDNSQANIASSVANFVLDCPSMEKLHASMVGPFYEIRTVLHDGSKLLDLLLFNEDLLMVSMSHD